MTSSELQNITAENSLLDAVQTANALTISETIGDEELSIADKVRTRLSIKPNQTAHLMVSVGTLTDAEDKPVSERVWIAVETAEPTQKNITHIAAAEVLGGTVVLPEVGFTGEEAVALCGMVRGLRLAQELGVLTNLSESLYSIENPPTADRIPLPIVKQ